VLVQAGIHDHPGWSGAGVREVATCRTASAGSMVFAVTAGLAGNQLDGLDSIAKQGRAHDNEG
jgi:hypothetical protein